MVDRAEKFGSRVTAVGLNQEKKHISQEERAAELKAHNWSRLGDLGYYFAHYNKQSASVVEIVLRPLYRTVRAEKEKSEPGWAQLHEEKVGRSTYISSELRDCLLAALKQYFDDKKAKKREERSTYPKL